MQDFPSESYFEEVLGKVTEVEKKGDLRASILERDKKHLAQAEEDLNLTQESILVLQSIGEVVKKSNTKETEDLVSQSLQEAFPEEDLEFIIQTDNRRGQSGIQFQINDKRKGVIDDPLESFGGGPGALAGVILRVMVILRQPNMKRFILMDEPLVQVSEAYEQGVSSIMRKICDPEEAGGLGFKILVVTHTNSLVSESHRHYKATNTNNTLQLSLEE